MHSELFSMKTSPAEWGMASMMERIEYIQKRFGPKMPKSNGGSEAFKAELDKQAGKADAAAAKAAKTGEAGAPERLFAPGTFKTDNVGNAQISEIISRASEKYNLDEKLLKAVIKTESGYNQSAVSSKGAMGLMQLMPGTAKELQVANPFDPVQNVDGGAKYLKEMFDRFGGSTPLALSAYNAGPKAVETYKGVPPYKETKDYVEKIMKMLGNEG